MNKDCDTVCAMLCSRFSNVFFYDLAPAQAEVITSSNSKRDYYYVYGARIETNGGTYLYALALTKEKKASKTLLSSLKLSSFHIRSYTTDKIEQQWNLNWDNLGEPQALTLRAYDSFKDISITEVIKGRKSDRRVYQSDGTFKATLFCEPAPDGDVNELPPNTTVIPAIDTMDIVFEF